MKFIPLEEAKRLTSELSGIPVKFLHKFDSLPTIDLSIIDEMIEEQGGKLHIAGIYVLQELKSRLLANSR